MKTTGISDAHFLAVATIAAGLAQRVYDRHPQEIDGPRSEGYYETNEQIIRDAVEIASGIYKEMTRLVGEEKK